MDLTPLNYLVHVDADLTSGNVHPSLVEEIVEAGQQ